MSRDVKDVNNDVEEVQGHIREVNDDVTEVKGNVEVLSRDVKDVKNGVEEVQGNIREVTDDVTEVKGNTEIVFRDSLRKIKEEIRKLEDVLSDKKERNESDKMKENTIPEELEHDPFTSQLYEKAIEEGTENDSAIRVMVIGCFRQGKTSLVRRLLKQSIEGVETTNGIEVQKCTMINDTEWEHVTEEDPEHESIRRLVNVATDFTTTSTPLYEPDKSETENVTPSENVLASTKSSSQRSSALTVDSKHLKQFQDELKRQDLAGDKLNKGVTINIWDFGGQFVYYATHQIFHSKQAVYVLVFNLTVELNAIVEDKEFPLHKKTMGDYLKFWVDSVNSFVGSVDGNEPPIVLVGTHADKLQDNVSVSEKFEKVRQLFDGSLCLNHIQPFQCAISNKDLSETNITQLRNCIYTLGTKQMHRSVPAKWILLEKSLKLAKAKKIVRFEDIMIIDKENERSLQTVDNEGSIKLFLRYHHSRGTFCYFDDDKLSQYVVLDPQYLIDAFKCIITSKEFCKVRAPLRKQWDELCSTAILRAELLENVWTHNDNQGYIKFRDLLTQFLQKHRIISEVLTYNIGTKSIEPQGYYIVPSFLKKSADVAISKAFCAGKSMSEVSIGYVPENETILPLLYQRCLAALVGRWPLVKFAKQFVVYDDLIACEVSHDHAGILMLAENRLELVVVNLCPPDGVNAEVCDMFRRYVELGINTDICKLHGLDKEKRLIKNTTVRCFHADHGSNGSDGILILEELRSKAQEKSPCPDKGNHCLKLQSILHEWFMQEIEIENVPSRKLSSKEYSSLSMAIGRGWQQIGFQLGLHKVEIDHIEMNNQTVEMQIYKMFLLWDTKKADEATLDVLVNVINKCPEQVMSVNWDVLKNIINGF